MDLRWPQVRKQAERLAQAEQRLLRPLGPRQVVVARTAHGTEENRIGLPGEGERRGGNLGARPATPRAADGRMPPLLLEPEPPPTPQGPGKDLLPVPSSGGQRAFSSSK